MEIRSARCSSVLAAVDDRVCDGGAVAALNFSVASARLSNVSSAREISTVFSLPGACQFLNSSIHTSPFSLIMT